MATAWWGGMRTWIAAIVAMAFIIPALSGADDGDEGRQRLELPLGQPVAPLALMLRDPIAPLGEGDASVLDTGKTLPPGFAKGFIDRYVDRIEAWHGEHSNPPEGLIPWLKTVPKLRRDFWLALSPYDDATAALGILDHLRKKDAKRLEDFRHLAIALAVVHDQPKNTNHSRRFSLWAVNDHQFGATLTVDELWDYFANPANQGRFLFKPRDLVWPVMVHLVDLDVSKAEVDWAMTTYGANRRVDLEALYHDVPYDNAKLKTRGQRTTLGDRDYTLMNLRIFGDVCVGQGHYASRVAKIFGVPALKCVGEGRYGSASLHAWSGYLAAEGGKPVLKFTGRYSFDYYYLGIACDPQVGLPVLDREIELLYAGAAGNFDGYRDAAALTRAALAVAKSQPAAAAGLVREALRLNPQVEYAWRLAMRLAREGVIPRSEADKWFKLLCDTLVPRFPDLGAWCFPDYLASIPTSDDAARQAAYRTMYAAFGRTQRPDLQIAVRLDQIDLLAKAGRSKEVVQLAFEAVGPNIKQGSLVMPLVQRLVELSVEFAKSDAGFRVDVVRKSLGNYSNEFPKARGDDLSPAWVEYQKLLDRLAPAQVGR
jgi:hypothetical protein